MDEDRLEEVSLNADPQLIEPGAIRLQHLPCSMDLLQCAANGWSSEVVQDLGSGLNYNKRGLRQLIKRICAGDIGHLVVTNKDRLLSIGAEIVFGLCEEFNVEVTIINQSDKPISFEEELARDVLEIITVFSGRLYGSRSHKNRKLVEKLQQAAVDL